MFVIANLYGLEAWEGDMGFDKVRDVMAIRGAGFLIFFIIIAFLIIICVVIAFGRFVTFLSKGGGIREAVEIGAMGKGAVIGEDGRGFLPWRQIIRIGFSIRVAAVVFGEIQLHAAAFKSGR